MDDRLLDAVIRERMIEKRARGRAFEDRDFWSAYIAAIRARRDAVDAYLKDHPVEPVEAETRTMDL